MKNGGTKQPLITEAFFPEQKVENLGTEVFNRVSAPTDWCTARQAQMYADAKVKPDSVTEDIASGRVESRVCSQKEAQEELAKQRQRSGNKERGG